MSDASEAGSGPLPEYPLDPDRTSGLFRTMVSQQVNMALMFLGRIPHPETGAPVRDLDAARFFIDQLEMIEAKTRGNLTVTEQSYLGQALTSLRMAFVEAVNAEGPGGSPAAPPAAPAQEAASDPAAGAEESRKKFSKKY